MKVLDDFGKKIRQAGLGAMLVGIMSVSLVACGEETSPNAPAATEPTATTASGSTGGSSSSGTMTDSAVALTEWAVALKETEVPAGKVKFTVTNDGKFSHNYVIMEGTNEVGRTSDFKNDAGPQILEVDLKPGSYKVLCDITGHPEKGMVNTLIVK